MFQPPTKRIKFEENIDHEATCRARVPINRKSIIHVDRDGKAIQRSKHHLASNWCTVFFGNVNQCDGYRLGKIILKLILNEPTTTYVELESDINNINVAQRFPGLNDIRIQAEGQTASSTNVIEFRTRRDCDAGIEMKHFTYHFEKLNLPPALFGKQSKLDTRKIFKIEFAKYDAIHKEIILEVKVYASAIKGDDSNYDCADLDMSHAIPVFDYYFLNKRNDPDMDISLTQYRSSDDAKNFFSLIREYHSYRTRPQVEDSVQDSRLIPQLLDFQKETVTWMLAREGVHGVIDDDEDDSSDQLQKSLSIQINKRISLRAFGNKCARDAYYSRASGCLSWEKEMVEKLPNRGGILADEMGLGKTIQMLSVILLHPRPDTFSSNTESNGGIVDGVKRLSLECPCGDIRDQQNRDIVTCRSCGISQHSVCVGFSKTDWKEAKKNYLCPCCCTIMPSKSTLIVVPRSLLKQWEDEITTNVSDDSLKIHIYSRTSPANKYIHPIVLSQYDIVLTTYELLRHEIDFTDLSEAKCLRDQKRYAVLPSPLILIEWWRICLDEAQMVENVNYKFAKMVRMLPAVHRWCVTGTPIQNDLRDLYGVVCFLGIEPINDIKWWDFLIMAPFRSNNCQITMVSNIFGKIFWRTEKEDVQDQLRLPRQTEVIHRLEFSTAEKYFYEQHSMFWLKKFEANIGNIDRDQPISVLRTNQLTPFRRLRYICTHPQLDEETFGAVDIFIERGALLTLNVLEFVKWLVKRETVKCVKQYKLRVTHLNALAGLHLLNNKLDDALCHYQSVIELAEENKNRWNTDDDDLLHAMVNCNDVTKKLGNGNGMDEKLIDELIEKLMQKHSKGLSSASHSIQTIKSIGNFGIDDDAWWIRAIEHIKDKEAHNAYLLQEFVHKFRKTIPLEFMIDNANLSFDFAADLESTMKQHLSKILTKRRELISDWTKINLLGQGDIPYLSLTLLDCGHFAIPDTRYSCLLCRFKIKLLHYESLISGETVDCVTNDVTTMKSMTENALKVIYEFAKKNQFDPTLLEAGRLHILQFCDLQNEIFHFWKWYNRFDDHDAALKKLIAATKPIEIEPARMEAEDKFKQELSADVKELQYVKGMQKYGYSCDGSIIDKNPEKCTVNHETQKWGFLPCCHFICANCHSTNAQRELTCPVCETTFTDPVIRFVETDSGSKHIVTNVPFPKITDQPIWRNPFTKVEAVIRTLLTIRESHPNEKALVICTCDAMLQVFAAEFHQNEISYILYNRIQNSKRQNALLRFRTDSTQVLLMPLAVASTGLNLTEANHVLLVEPCPNFAIEEQAIGRIHRLGQKKPTFVHRFYVANTIEEKLIRMDKNKKMSTFEEGDMTIQDLLDIFN